VVLAAAELAESAVAELTAGMAVSAVAELADEVLGMGEVVLPEVESTLFTIFFFFVIRSSQFEF
jgi:hypothetical protein